MEPDGLVRIVRSDEQKDDSDDRDVAQRRGDILDNPDELEEVAAAVPPPAPAVVPHFVQNDPLTSPPHFAQKAIFLASSLLEAHPPPRSITDASFISRRLPDLSDGKRRGSIGYQAYPRRRLARKSGPLTCRLVASSPRLLSTQSRKLPSCDLKTSSRMDGIKHIVMVTSSAFL